jgi:hypothetical protein
MSFIEWVAVSDEALIAADCDGNSICIDITDELRPLFREMNTPGTPASTRALLDGAIARSFEGREPPPLRMTLSRYVLDLVSAYHNSTRTPGHFRRAAQRFAGIGRPDLASYLEKHAREETGHDRLALKDLNALGYDAENLVRNLVPDGVRGLVDLFDRFVDGPYPIGTIGYSYAFERTALIKGQSEVDAIVALCPPGVDAVRFLRSHSSLGSEASHVEDLVEFIAGLPASDRIQIVQAAHRTARVMFERGCWHRALSDADVDVLLADSNKVQACKRDALQHLERDGPTLAVAAMISDIRGCGLGPTYDAQLAVGVHLRDEAGVRDWIAQF